MRSRTNVNRFFAQSHRANANIPRTRFNVSAKPQTEIATNSTSVSEDPRHLGTSPEFSSCFFNSGQL